MEFSLIFFSGDEKNKYRLMLDAASFADEQGFAAIWTPERHFHRFGGLYPNPSVVGAALAMVTRRLQIRAGSVVAPLHSPLRIAEEWAVVDNLSRGRVGIALATGFSPVDFALRPEAWEHRRDITFKAVETIRQLWEGLPLSISDGVGNQIEVELRPQPVQPELPLWLTCTKSKETFHKAGELGCHILTGLVDMTTEELAEKISLYRASLASHGFDPTAGVVTLMLHTFIGQDLEAVRQLVWRPFTTYLRSFLTVIDSQKQSLAPGKGVRDLAEAEQEALIAFAFEKYFNKGSLLGTPDSCVQVVERFREIGVNEIACLIDFGVDEDLVVESLKHLAELRARVA